jgi:hypothetical protein
VLFNVLACHFNHLITILMPSSSNIHEKWQAVKWCHGTTFDAIKLSNKAREGLKWVVRGILGRTIQLWHLYLKLTKASLNIHRKWHIVTLVSNDVRKSWNFVWRLILGRGIQTCHLFLKLKNSSLIIHR